MKKKTNNKTTMGKGNMKYQSSILLEVDEATKGIMEEIQNGISGNLENIVINHQKELKKIDDKVEEMIRIQKENKRMLDKIFRMLDEISED